MIIVCIDYLLLIIVCLRYAFISYIYREVFSQQLNLLNWGVRQCRTSPTAKPHCGSDACGQRQCHTLNSNQNSAQNGKLLWGPISSIYFTWPPGNPLFPHLTPTSSLSLLPHNTATVVASILPRCHFRWCRTVLLVFLIVASSRCISWTEPFHFFPPQSTKTKVKP